MSGERGWMPELLYTDGRFVRNTALFADATGKIHRSGEFAPVGSAAKTARPLSFQVTTAGCMRQNEN